MTEINGGYADYLPDILNKLLKKYTGESLSLTGKLTAMITDRHQMEPCFPTLEIRTFVTNQIISNAKSYENRTCCGNAVAFIEIKKQSSRWYNKLHMVRNY